MSYLVLARKYRPQTFEEVIGQEPITRTLRNALEQERVHHAYLFCGSRGVGKTTTARLLAKALNCEKGPTPNPCDKCASCKEIREGSAVDVIEIDGASHTGVDDVRNLRESARYLPARGKRKVYIIDEVHMLSTSAFNALLKTLEEPPEHVSFIFATTEPHKIPATILSRCQRFDFRRLPDSGLREHLANIVKREKIKVDEAGLGLIARAADGSVRDSLSLLDQVIAYAGKQKASEKLVAEVLGVADRRSLHTLAEAVLVRDAQKALGVVQEVFGAGQDLSRLAQSFLGYLRDLVVAASVAKPDSLLDLADGDREAVVAQAKGAEKERLLAMFERFSHATEEIGRSQNSKVLLEVAIVDLIDAGPLLPLGDLLERLEGLESRLGGDSSTAASAPPSALPGRSSKGSSAPAAPASFRSPTAATAPAQRPASTSAPAAKPKQRSGPARPLTPDRWNELVRELGSANPQLGGTYALAKPLKVSEKEILLGLPTGSFVLEQASSSTGALQEFITANWGHTPDVRVEAVAEEIAAAAPLSVSEIDAAKQLEDRDRRKREALNHPTIQAAVDLLDGDIRDIRTE